MSSTEGIALATASTCVFSPNLGSHVTVLPSIVAGRGLHLTGERDRDPELEVVQELLRDLGPGEFWTAHVESRR